ncbi:Oidioi.mRNA.OKI2018_I69.chr1.g3174.t1.cds [Oikopleura dioica]|uniref:Oidioi.mRNA.OKI2018_I69.chr1.g3174.t1.cds n=1 Tax=Oikopleura dioica TaxID=34765 RepID=A0ABN7STD2_OIKDI|nr:Oidioi.mRNA.OKI2018_I69.chr1.g3174.t1.cds [Oikopleura dioica]
MKIARFIFHPKDDDRVLDPETEDDPAADLEDDDLVPDPAPEDVDDDLLHITGTEADREIEGIKVDHLIDLDLHDARELLTSEENAARLATNLQQNRALPLATEAAARAAIDPPPETAPDPEASRDPDLEVAPDRRIFHLS